MLCIMQCMGTTTPTQNPAAGGTSYRLTKRFTDGPYAGSTHTSTTSVRFEVGQVIEAWAYGDGYVVEACDEVQPDTCRNCGLIGHMKYTQGGGQGSYVCQDCGNQQAVAF